MRVAAKSKLIKKNLRLFGTLWWAYQVWAWFVTVVCSQHVWWFGALCSLRLNKLEITNCSENTHKFDVRIIFHWEDFSSSISCLYSILKKKKKKDSLRTCFMCTQTLTHICLICTFPLPSPLSIQCGPTVTVQYKVSQPFLTHYPTMKSRYCYHSRDK